VLRHGYTVISMEHRDGSACAAFTLEGRHVPFLNLSHLPDDDALEIRKHQLQFRSAEIDLALNAFNKSLSQRKFNVEFNSVLSSYLFDCNNVIQLAGHSFGAATCIYHSSL
jgi:hypothetical protein